MPHKQQEIRSFAGGELRVMKDARGERTIQGLIPYNTASADLGGFTEVIAPGAFASALEPGADVLCLRDHDQKILLGRTKSRTLTLHDSPEGLRFSVNLPNTTQAADLIESVERGDLDANSFGFLCERDRWTGGAGTAVRTLQQVTLFEISPCSFPAYSASSVALRSCPPEIRSGLNIATEKRYKRVLSAVSGTHWAITESKLQTICDVLATRAVGGHMSQEEIQAAMMAQKPSEAQSKGSVGIIPIYGVISQRMNLFSEFSGGSSIEILSSNFRAALVDPDVKTIVFDIDSPGGDVCGVPEFAAEIFAARGQKKMIAVSNAQAGSAAYFLASQADEIVVTPSGAVGSIGVYCVHEDDSGWLAQNGVKMTIVKAGKFKAEGNSYEPLSKDTVEAWQKDIDSLYGMFIESVARGRGVDTSAITGGFGQGRMVLASEAVALGMADRVATLDQVLAELGASDSHTQMNSYGLLTNETEGNTDDESDDNFAERAQVALELRKRRIPDFAK